MGIGSIIQTGKLLSRVIVLSGLLAGLAVYAHAQDAFSSGSKPSFGSSIKNMFTSKPSNGVYTPSPDDPTSLSGKGKPSPELYVAMGRLKEQEGKTAEAEGYFKKALSMDPKNLNAHLAYALFFENQKRYQEAVDTYQKTIKLYPNDASVYNNLGLCHERKNKHEDAVNALGRAVQLDPRNALYRNNLAAVYIEQGRTSEAYNILREVHGDAAAYYNVGYLLQKKGQTDAAIHHFAQALRIDPTMAPAQRWLSYLQGQTSTTMNMPTSSASSSRVARLNNYPYASEKANESSVPYPSAGGSTHRESGEGPALGSPQGKSNEPAGEAVVVPMDTSAVMPRIIAPNRANYSLPQTLGTQMVGSPAANPQAGYAMATPPVSTTTPSAMSAPATQPPPVITNARSPALAASNSTLDLPPDPTDLSNRIDRAVTAQKPSGTSPFSSPAKTNRWQGLTGVATNASGTGSSATGNGSGASGDQLGMISAQPSAVASSPSATAPLPNGSSSSPDKTSARIASRLPAPNASASTGTMNNDSMKSPNVSTSASPAPAYTARALDKPMSSSVAPDIRLESPPMPPESNSPKRLPPVSSQQAMPLSPQSSNGAVSIPFPVEQTPLGPSAAVIPALGRYFSQFLA